MFRLAAHSALRRVSAQIPAQRVRHLATAGATPIPPGFLRKWYNTFGKSTALYASWLVMFIVVGEFTTGKLTDWAWTANNYGKTFSTVDWSRFDDFEEEGGDDDDDDE
ncbi:hypothetical protein MPSEU_000704100 [Mayamaea pseudoterrestris]|nr:hypothetical protein MPSEU_000704100 [Mayamaea pseudoterrestris]